MTEVIRLFKKVAYFDLFKIKNDIIKGDMKEFEFVEDNEFHIKSRRLLGEPTTPTMISFLIKVGIVKNEKQALMILVLTILLTITATLFLIFQRTSPNDGFVQDKFGNKYTAEEYVNLIKQGKDPLAPNFTP